MAPTPHLGFFTESAGPSSVHLEHVDYYQSEKRRAGVMTPIGLDEQGGASSRVKIIRGPGAATNGSSSNSHPISTSSIGKQTGISDVERKERDKRKSREVTDSVGRYAKDLADRKDEIFANAMVPLTATSRVLFSQPAASPAYAMRLYPITLERAAMLDALDVAEQYALDTLRATWDEEQQKVEEEWRQGKIKVKERCLEAIEERRKRAREEKDGEGLVGADAGADSSVSRSKPTDSHKSIMFKLIAPTTSYSTSIDDIASPFPLSLTSTVPSNSSATANGRRRQNRGGLRDGAGLVLGKAAIALTGLREGEIESDLGEIRKGVKRRRAAAKNV